MRTLTRLYQVIVTVIALTVLAPGHAETVQQIIPITVEQMTTEAEAQLNKLVHTLSEPIVKFNFSKKDVDCLARNIYYEAANESEEGKVAVGMVTLNRVQDGRFPKSICGVVNQRTVLSIPKKITIRPKKFHRKKLRTTTVWQKLTVCQFSWTCMFVPKPRRDERWQQSTEVAQSLLEGRYKSYQKKYANAMYFHAVKVRPRWVYQKKKIAREGGHIFYSEKKF